MSASRALGAGMGGRSGAHLMVHPCSSWGRQAGVKRFYLGAKSQSGLEPFPLPAMHSAEAKGSLENSCPAALQVLPYGEAHGLHLLVHVKLDIS